MESSHTVAQQRRTEGEARACYRALIAQPVLHTQTRRRGNRGCPGGFQPRRRHGRCGGTSHSAREGAGTSERPGVQDRADWLGEMRNSNTQRQLRHLLNRQAGNKQEIVIGRRRFRYQGMTKHIELFHEGKKSFECKVCHIKLSTKNLLK